VGDQDAQRRRQDDAAHRVQDPASDLGEEPAGAVEHHEQRGRGQDRHGVREQHPG